MECVQRITYQKCFCTVQSLFSPLLLKTLHNIHVKSYLANLFGSFFKVAIFTCVSWAFSALLRSQICKAVCEYTCEY